MEVEDTASTGKENHTAAHPEGDKKTVETIDTSGTEENVKQQVWNKQRIN